MGNKRKTNHALPPQMQESGGSYYWSRYEGPPGARKKVWTPLGDALGPAIVELARLRAVVDPGNLAELIDNYIADNGKTLNDKPFSLATQKMYLSCAAMMKPALYSVRPKQFTPDLAAEMRDTVEAGHGKITANHCLSLLSGAYSLAINKQVLKGATNPIRDVARCKPPERKRYIENTEYARLQAASGPAMQATIDLAYLTGQRVSDVLKMRKDDVRDGELMVTQNKGESRLAIQISPEIRACLKALEKANQKRRRKNSRGVEADTLVQTVSGTQYTRGGFLTEWRKAKLKSGVPDAHFHDLRAKALTDVYTTTGSIDAAQRLAGHKSVEMTEHYIKLRARIEAAPVQRLPGKSPLKKPVKK